MSAQWSLRKLGTGIALAVLLVCAGAGPAPADPLAVEKNGAVTVEKSLEVGPNGTGINDKGATIQGLNGRNFFQDEEKAGALRVGSAWNIPGIYSEKGDVVVGSQSNRIQLKGDVTAGSYVGMGAIPVGAITMWYGKPSAVPDGWVLCDGTNDTPDLSGRFIAGLALGDSDYGKIGNTGGEKQVTLTLGQMPKHSHDGTTEKDSGVGIGEEIGGDHVLAKAAWKGGHWHFHNFTTNDAGGGLPHENRPPYMVLAYIMYKGWSLPSGSYRESCRKIARDGSKLKGECRKPDGTWQQTQLDTSGCKEGTIGNSNGALGCTTK